jgi:hypothetical protein
MDCKAITELESARYGFINPQKSLEKPLGRAAFRKNASSKVKDKTELESARLVFYMRCMHHSTCNTTKSG